jgi:hypothetical protein
MNSVKYEWREVVREQKITLVNPVVAMDEVWYIRYKYCEAMKILD